MTRREKGEELYRRKFEDYGLTEKFTFLRREWSMDHDKRFWCRCNTCGAEFLSWNEVFKGRQKHLLCPECGAASDGEDVKARSPKVDRAMDFYAAGHSVRETAEKFGFSMADISNFVKARGVTNGREWQKAGTEAYRRACERKKYAREVEREQKSQEQKRLLEERRRQRELEKARERELKIAERERARQMAEAERTDALFHLMNDKSHICMVCGRAFSTAEVMEDKGLKLTPFNPKYCSKKCERRAINKARKQAPSGKTGNYYIRAQKYGVEYVPGITLKKLIRRDGLQCAICGEMCDVTDHGWTEYSGPLYPSIDHIVPMSKGGGHTWSNVQIAHIICNSRKGNCIEEASA